MDLLKKVFEGISKEENCKLTVIHEPAFSKLITFSPFMDENKGERIKSLELEIEYKNQLIIVTNEIGDAQVGKFRCKIDLNSAIPNFSLTTRSHYLRLLNPGLSTIKISCKDSEFKEYISQKLSQHNIESIARSSQFFPKMNAVQNDRYEISLDYSLIFNQKKEVVKPIIEFYKSLIDYIVEID